MVVSTSNLVETVTARCASRDTLSRSGGQLERKYKYGGHSGYPKQKSTENVLVSPKYRALKGNVLPCGKGQIPLRYPASEPAR